MKTYHNCPVCKGRNVNHLGTNADDERFCKVEMECYDCGGVYTVYFTVHSITVEDGGVRGRKWQ